MKIPVGKKVVCITGSVWTGSYQAPRRLLVKDGFVRPVWFTTRAGINDAEYEKISDTEYRLSRAKNNILVDVKYAMDFIGIMKESFSDALEQSALGVLVVGPQDIVAKIAEKIPQTTIFTLKSKQMELSKHLKKAKLRGQVKRIDIDVQEPGAWDLVHQQMLETLDLD